MFQIPEHPGQCFTSKVADSHPQLPGWFCPQTDRSDSGGNQVVLSQEYQGYTVAGGSVYNTCQLFYDASTKGESLWINGTEQTSYASTFVPSAAQLIWGGGYQSPDPYKANWSLVSFQIVPEPSAAPLILMGMGMLMFLIRRGHT